jgi:hypothetical protein
MNQTKITVVWEEIHTPESVERVAAAFAMLLSPLSAKHDPYDKDLDSSD